MASVQYLREFVNERLTSAVEEIFGVIEKTIVEYEEEISRQRRLLDIVWKPQVRLHRTELPQQYVCKEEEVLTDQQLCNQDRNSSLDQEDPESLQIKDEKEEHHTSQAGGQLLLKQETDTSTLTPTCEESDHSEPEPLSNHQLLSHNSTVAESQDQEGSKHRDSGSTRNTVPKSKATHCKNRSRSENVNNASMSKTDCYTQTGEKSFKCETCGKAFKYRCRLYLHMRTHTGEKPYSCDKCEKSFRYKNCMLVHMRIHTGEKPFSCSTCGKCFRYRKYFLNHMRAHTGESSYLCKICGKSLRTREGLLVHTRTHTGETPYLCNTCGRRFNAVSILKIHMRTHTGEKPYSCEICGKRFTISSELKVHKRIHTGEKPYSCETCGKSFVRNSVLKVHKRTHTSDKPYSCETWEKNT